MRNGTELTYSAIEQTEEAWADARSFFSGAPGFVPPASFGLGAVAKNQSNEIVSGLILQILPYLGPFKTRDDYQGKVDYSRLKSIIDGTFSKGKFPSLIIQGYVAMTADERVAKLAEFAGMKRIHPIVLIQNLMEQDCIPL